MGNVSSEHSERQVEDIWWCPNNMATNNNPNPTSSRELSSENKEKLNEFKLELARKHEKRREIIAEKRKEMQELREEVASLRQQLKHGKLEDNSEETMELERLRLENLELKRQLEEKCFERSNYDSLQEKNKELRVNIAQMQLELQELNTIAIDFEKEREEYQAHVVALKNVITVSKQMLQIREVQLNELKEKITDIEKSLEGREMHILSEDLRKEYERQLENIKNLRVLYEERQRSNAKEKEELNAVLDHVRKNVQEEQKKNSEFEERIRELEEETSTKYDEIKSLESNLGLAKAETRQCQAELSVINQLFSEILLGFNNSQEIDLDSLKNLLEQHHDLLQNIVVNEVSSEVSYALPKILLDLVHKANSKVAEDKEEEPQAAALHQMHSTEEIMQNLPKVWRVLIELLSHQQAPFNNLPEEESDETHPCYKVVETPKGPSLVLSVSQTFIRLKDLILEKKSLEKETNHLKQLNTHLETRLQDQEKRLEMVSSELTKTWHVVGTLQKQHQLLHTQEKILRYELAQKRKLLNTLKEELEYSREKWQQAREKNSNTEQQWKLLRTEFASRRNTVTDDCNNSSVESGYSDEREYSSEEDDLSEGNKRKLEESTNNQEMKTEESTKGEGEGVVKEEEEEINQALEVESQVLVEASTEETQEDVNNTPTPTVSSEELPQIIDSNSTEGAAAPSQAPLEVKPVRTLEEVLAAREERLSRLEGQCLQLVTKVTNTSNKSVVISNKLDDLHEAYGGDNKEQASGAGEASSSRQSDEDKTGDA